MSPCTVHYLLSTEQIITRRFTTTEHTADHAPGEGLLWTEGLSSLTTKAKLERVKNFNYIQ